MLVERSASLAADALAFLEQDGLGNELLLGAALRGEAGQAGPSFRWWVLREGGLVQGVILFCPPYGATLSCMDKGVARIMGNALVPFLPALSAVHAPDSLEDVIAGLLESSNPPCRTELWVARSVCCKNAEGRWGWAQREHGPLVERWVKDAWPGGENKGQVRRWIEAKRVMLWFDAQGTPVATAVTTRDFDWGSCLGFVYCEPSMRRRGYAAAVVSACCREVLALANRCVFLQVGNGEEPAKRLYRSLGFLPERGLLSWVGSGDWAKNREGRD